MTVHQDPTQNIRAQNPYNRSKDFQKWRDWQDDNEPSFHGQQRSKYTVDHQLKPRFDPDFKPPQTQTALIEKRFREELGMTVEEANIQNAIGYYHDELIAVAKTMIRNPDANLNRLLIKYELPKDLLVRCGILKGNKSKRLSEEAYQRLGIQY